MKKKKDKPTKKGGWLKVIMGLLFFGIQISKKDKRGSREIKIAKSIIAQKQNLEDKKEKLQEKHAHAQNKDKSAEKEREEEKKGWLKAQPEQLPSPTYWPFFLALGLAFLFWGIIASWVILAVGLLVFIVALAGWINILRHEK